MKHGTSVTYLAARINRDHPDIAAGIVKPHDAYSTACRAWAKMIPEERDAFEDWIADWRQAW